MQPVRIRKTHRPHKIRAILTVLLLLVVLLPGITLLKRSPDHPIPDASNTEADMNILEHDDSLISMLEVFPSRSESYVLLQNNGQLVLQDDPEYPMREETIRQLAYYATHMTADELVTTVQTTHNNSAYGLDPGVCRVYVRLTTGEDYTIVIGNTVPMEEARYYVRLLDDQRIWTVTSDVMDALNVPFYALHTITRLSIDADLIDRISISTDRVFTALRTEEGWMMTEPVRYPLSVEAISTLLSAMEGLRFSTWVGDNTEKNRILYGFEPPKAVVSIDFAPSVLTVPDESDTLHTFQVPESNITISMGNAYSETADYYLYEDDIMTGTIVTFSFLKSFEWAKYLSAPPFIFEQNNLSAVIISGAEALDSYEISYTERILPNNELETDEYGNTLYEMRVKKNGVALTPYSFSMYYEQLRATSGQRLLPVPWSPGKEDRPYLSIRVVNEKKTAELNVSLYPLSDSEDYLCVDGISLFAVPLTWGEAFQSYP